MVRCFIVEFFYRTLVDQSLHPSYRIRTNVGYVGSFRDETSDDSEPVFHRPLVLPSVRAGEIGINAEYPRYILMIAESLVVVEGDGMAG